METSVVPVQAAVAPVVPVPDVAAEIRAKAAAEMLRVAEVQKVCDGFPAICASAIGENWSIDKARASVAEIKLENLRAERPNVGPAIVVHDHERDCNVEALQGAMILRAGGKLDHPCYQSQAAHALKIPKALRLNINAETRQKMMEAAHRYSSKSLFDICCESLRLSNKPVHDSREETIRAAFSGSALNDIFTTNVNAILLAAYMSSGDTTIGWTSTTDVSDFKTQERPRVQVGAGLSRLPRGSEADHADFSDVVESYKIRRFAKQFVVDEQDIIDDSMNALSDTPRRFGEAAGWIRPDMVYSIIIDNDALGATAIALFHADQDQGTGNGNLDTSSALTAATLKIGVSRMSLFQENSRNLNIKATHLIVPPSLIWTARELVESGEILFGGDDETTRGSKNVLQGVAAIVSDARLENGVTDPVDDEAQTGSAVNWFLASSNVPTIEVAYLRGTGQAPQVRSFVLDKGKWGMGWDVKLDIGAKALDWRGMYRAEG